VAACVERLHPDVRFVSEIGGEDMKTIFFTATGTGPLPGDQVRSKQVYMQSACSGGTGTFIEKTARKLQVPGERLAAMPYEGMSLHKVSSKCGIFAETDANTLVKTGVPVEEIGAAEKPEIGVYQGADKLKWWVEVGQHEQKAKQGARGLIAGEGDLATFVSEYVRPVPDAPSRASHAGSILIGCDFGSTTAKAVVLSDDRELLFSCYALSKGNPIEDAQSLFRQVR